MQRNLHKVALEGELPEKVRQIAVVLPAASVDVSGKDIEDHGDRSIEGVPEVVFILALAEGPGEPPAEALRSSYATG